MDVLPPHRMNMNCNPQKSDNAFPINMRLFAKCLSIVRRWFSTLRCCSSDNVLLVGFIRSRKAAFMAVAMDPARLAAQHAHREVAIADTYTMILRPRIDKLTPRD